jgi:hypothetical protein
MKDVIKLAISIVLATTAARADDKDALKVVLFNGSAIIGQSIACDLAKNRLLKVMNAHAATIDALSNHDPKMMKMRDDIIQMAVENERSRPEPRCSTIEKAFSTFEASLRDKGLLAK